MAIAALTVAAAASGGGVAALAMKKLRGTTGVGETNPTTETTDAHPGALITSREFGEQSRCS
jgi:hypothetical protein